MDKPTTAGEAEKKKRISGWWWVLLVFMLIIAIAFLIWGIASGNAIAWIFFVIFLIIWLILSVWLIYRVARIGFGKSN